MGGELVGYASRRRGRRGRRRRWRPHRKSGACQLPQPDGIGILDHDGTRRGTGGLTCRVERRITRVGEVAPDVNDTTGDADIVGEPEEVEVGEPVKE